MLADHISFQSVLCVGGGMILLALFTVLLGREPGSTAAQPGEGNTTPHGQRPSLFAGGMRTALKPVARGSITAPASAETPLGRTKHSSAGTFT